MNLLFFISFDHSHLYDYRPSCQILRIYGRSFVIYFNKKKKKSFFYTFSLYSQHRGIHTLYICYSFVRLPTSSGFKISRWTENHVWGRWKIKRMQIGKGTKQRMPILQWVPYQEHTRFIFYCCCVDIAFFHWKRYFL